MDNLVWNKIETFPISIGSPVKTAYEHATKTILIIDSNNTLFFIDCLPQKNQIQIRNSIPIGDYLQESNVVVFEYLVENESALIALEKGVIMVVSESGNVQIKAQNDDGISAGSVSPAQEYAYFVTKNNTLIQLDMEFDLVKQIPLDEPSTQVATPVNPKFSWKADGTFFAINIQTNKGRKCHTRDSSLGIFRTPSKSDVEKEGLVQSVSESSRQNMGAVVAWQPSGALIAGSDFVTKNNKKTNRIIFWEKNTLRHLQFDLPEQVVSVLELSWSSDSLILNVQVLLSDDKRYLYLFHRSNYQWELKNSIALSSPNTHYFSIKTKRNQLVIIQKQQIKILQYSLSTIPNSWKTFEQQSNRSAMLQVRVDGKKLHITDFSIGLIPPPMSHHIALFQSNISGVATCDNYVLVFTNAQILLCEWLNLNLDKRTTLNNGSEELLLKCVNLRLFVKQNQTTFTIDGNLYQINEDKTVNKIQQQHISDVYYLKIEQTIKQFHAQLKDSSLTFDNEVIAEHCSSFIFYHQFLIFTISSSSMYDKLFVIDLQLEKLNNIKESVKARLQQFESKKLLNFRTIERGAKIVGCSKNRVVFQLPRGNLEGIFPKVVTIKHVKKCMQTKKFKEAFETIRTHKLDLNLLFDIDPVSFSEHALEILTNIKRTDYLNLFISQLKDQLSSQLVFCLTAQKIEQVQQFVSVRCEGHKIKYVCEIVSKVLRECDKNRYILSIFTSDIKMGLLNQVLFQIKDMRVDDEQKVKPPHLQEQKEEKGKNKLNSQQILEYVCWLVDANAIYEAALLTYDLELASMTARCTQMDPKQYIPYIEQLKSIEDPVELRRKICMDLKKNQQAVIELSKGSAAQVDLSLELTKKYKLFKCALRTYDSRPEQLKRVKLMVIEQLLATGESNQAYKMCLSMGSLDKAWEIAVQLTDGRKIKQVLECDHTINQKERREKVVQVIDKIGEDGFKNKGELAKLKAYIGEYQVAASLYIRAGDYVRGYRCFVKSSKQYQSGSEFKQGMILQHSLLKNSLLKQKQLLMEKGARLTKVQKSRASQPSATLRNLENDDMYSEVSMSSKASSSYTISTTTGLRKKKDNKRSILSRNVKEGSPLEQEYLVAYLHDLVSKAQPNIKQTKLLIQHLIYLNLIKQAESLRDVCKQYAHTASRTTPKFQAQLRFEQEHPEFLELLSVYENGGLLNVEKERPHKDRFTIDSFAYLF